MREKYRINPYEGRTDVRPSSVRTFAERLSTWWDWCAKHEVHTPLAASTKVQRYIDALQGRSPNTISSYLDGIIPWFGLHGIEIDRKSLRIPPKRRRLLKGRPLSNEEARALLDRAGEWSFRPLIYLGLLAGMRGGEILNLRWDEVDFLGRKIYVLDGKSKDDRAIPMCEELFAFLGEWKRDHEHGPLVYHNRGKQIRNYPFRDVKKKAKLDGGHCLRRTFATRLVERGVSLYKVSRLLGHQSIETTMKYIYLEVGSEELTEALSF